MKKILLSATIAVLLFTISCKKDDEKLPFSQLYGIEDYAKAQKELKMYSLYGVYPDGVAKLYLGSRPNTDKVYGEVTFNYRADDQSAISNGGDFYIGDIKGAFGSSGFYDNAQLIYKDNSIELGQHLKEQYFGKENQYKLVRDGQTIYDKKIYIPKGIEMATFKNKGIQEFTNHYGINRNDFELTWNADDANKNGVLVLLSWDGNSRNTQLDKLSKGGYYYKAAWFSDTGKATLPSDFFNTVPKGALLSVQLIRANIEMIKGTDNRNYKIYGFSEDTKMCNLLD